LQNVLDIGHLTYSTPNSKKLSFSGSDIHHMMGGFGN